MSLRLIPLSVILTLLVPISPAFGQAKYKDRNLSNWVADLESILWPERLNAAKALAIIGPTDSSTVTPLLKAIQVEEWDELKVEMLAALAKYGPKAQKTLPSLCNMAFQVNMPFHVNMNEKVRSACRTAVESIDANGIYRVEILTEADKNALVTAEILSILHSLERSMTKKSDQKSAIQALHRLTGNPSAEVRLQASKMLIVFDPELHATSALVQGKGEPATRLGCAILILQKKPTMIADAKIRLGVLDAMRMGLEKKIQFDDLYLQTKKMGAAGKPFFHMLEALEKLADALDSDSVIAAVKGIDSQRWSELQNLIINRARFHDEFVLSLAKKDPKIALPIVTELVKTRHGLRAPIIKSLQYMRDHRETLLPILEKPSTDNDGLNSLNALAAIHSLHPDRGMELLRRSAKEPEKFLRGIAIIMNTLSNEEKELLHAEVAKIKASEKSSPLTASYAHLIGIQLKSRRSIGIFDFSEKEVNFVMKVNLQTFRDFPYSSWASSRAISNQLDDLEILQHLNINAIRDVNQIEILANIPIWDKRPRAATVMLFGDFPNSVPLKVAHSPKSALEWGICLNRNAILLASSESELKRALRMPEFGNTLILERLMEKVDQQAAIQHAYKFSPNFPFLIGMSVKIGDQAEIQFAAQAPKKVSDEAAFFLPLLAKSVVDENPKARWELGKATTVGDFEQRILQVNDHFLDSALLGLLKTVRKAWAAP